MHQLITQEHFNNLYEVDPRVGLKELEIGIKDFETKIRQLQKECDSTFSQICVLRKRCYKGLASFDELEKAMNNWLRIERNAINAIEMARNYIDAFKEGKNILRQRIANEVKR
jgi:hypothetical protein